ncbi:carboxymuconolactone decarboxylase family protein [Nocardioides terrisoli]|uniref:carboxymuconolactone decarboxylase family protein n=1 Tax=Nocardioides terrisoli TaxID=3388267 RepID=UPI00287B5FA9|nr:carboxymuconolactone decarboxylase family protein [Nocardioides marmorisolisilvae]
MTGPRITPGGLRENGPLIWGFAQIAGRVTGTTPPNVFSTLGRGRGLFWGWLHFSGKLMPGGKLPRRLTELAIIRVAHLRGCQYELDHHVRLGRRAGVTAEDLERVYAGPDTDGWTPAEQALLRAVDELVHEKDISDPTWTALRSAYDDRRVLELVMLVGHYDALATTLLTLRVQPDRRR